MIRRKRETVAQRERREFRQSQPIGIGESLQEKKDREDAHESAVIQATRAEIWKTRRHCQYCGGRRQKECGRHEDAMHEEPSRAQTRGLPPEQRFNLKVCGRACWACHQDLTGRIGGTRAYTVFSNPALGFQAPVWMAYAK